MPGGTIGFILWCVFGCLFICLAAYTWFSKKPMGFWANAEVFEVSDVKKYNHALSWLFCTYGIVLIVLGLPLLAGPNSPWIVITILGIMLESIAAMIVYSAVIEKKYKKRK